MQGLIWYDPVQEAFTVVNALQEKMDQVYAVQQEGEAVQETDRTDKSEEQSNLEATLLEMDDAVLLSNDTDIVEEEEEESDDMLTQLKKRREQLQLMLTAAAKENPHGYRQLPSRQKEREARLNYLRDRVVPGQTVLVLDTNCFIGHFEHIKRLIMSNKWLIVVPLVGKC